MKKRTVTFIVLALIVSPLVTLGQALYQPYSYQFYQKLDNVLYNVNTRLHTSVKPFIIDSVLQPRYDSLMNLGVSDRKTWVGRKIWNEHLIDIKNDEYTFYADFIPDFMVGRSFKESTTTWLNTRGMQLGATIGKNFSFYTNFFENQARFPDYVNNYIFDHQVVPGQQGKLYDHRTGDNQDWSYVTANISYTPTKFLNISLGYDKTFIGDGYRSVLLSDFSSNYSNLKLTAKLGNVQYMSMWAYMLDPYATRQIYPDNPDGTRTNTGDLAKWGAFQYLDWNISNRVSVGFFQSILWAPRNANGHRGFDFNYLNPIIFLRPVESANTSSPDKVHLGLTAKYKVLDNLTTYGQFLLGEFSAGEFFKGNGYMHNKYAVQLGFKGFDVFKVKRLNYLVEFNTARPYTYQHFTPITSYTNYNQPLAHPFGANFREFISIWNYSYHRFDFSLQGIYARYGKDPDAATNYGGDIFKTYDNFVHEYGNKIGQGILTDYSYLDFKAAYLLNPKYNLRFEVGATTRTENNALAKSTTTMLNIGLRASFRNLYYDF